MSVYTRVWDRRVWNCRVWDRRVWDRRVWDRRVWDRRVWDRRVQEATLMKGHSAVQLSINERTASKIRATCCDDCEQILGETNWPLPLY